MSWKSFQKRNFAVEDGVFPLQGSRDCSLSLSLSAMESGAFRAMTIEDVLMAVAGNAGPENTLGSASRMIKAVVVWCMKSLRVGCGCETLSYL